MIKNISIQWKISGNSVFSGQAQVAPKILNDKKYIFNTVNSGQTLLFRARASCSKIPNGKKYFNTVKNFTATLFFRASASCSKLLNVKVYSIQWKISGQLCFSGQSQVAQKSWMVKNIFITVENFTVNSVFQGKVKKFSIQYIQPVKAFTLKFLVLENTTRKELHPLELTSKVTTEVVYDGASRGLYIEGYCRIEVISQLKCMQEMPSGPNKM